MKISSKPTGHILVKANCQSEWDSCDFAIIACDECWREGIKNKLEAAGSFEAPGSFISMRFYDNSPDFYVLSGEEELMLRKVAEWAFITLEEREKESFAEPENRLEAASLILYKNGTGYYKAYGKYSHEEFYTAEIPLREIWDKLNAAEGNE